MNKFLELSLMNHLRNHDELREPYEECFNPVIAEIGKYLSADISENISELLMDCCAQALYVAGVMGMELAIGVMNGTIKQEIE